MLHRTGRLATVLTALAVAVAGLTVNTGEATALTPPAETTATLPETVSADPLPTVQINGVVWDQVIVGNTVYVGGEFTRARPAGVAPGVNETVRNNMLAYRLDTGELVASFNPDLNGHVKDLAVTPDQSKLVAVGAFTTVEGQSRSRVAVFDLPAGTLSTSVVPAIGGYTQSVAATNSTLYFGGWFSSINGANRARIGAVRASDGSTLPFRPAVDNGIVQSIVVAPDERSVVISGNFTSVGGSSTPGYGLARLDAATGASQPLPVNNTVRNAGENSGILRLQTDGTFFYGVGWHYGRGGNLEGYFAAKWSDGTLAALQDCHGDHYDVAPIGEVVYTSSHAHYCANSGGFPQTTPGTNRHGHAWTREPMGVNKADMYDYPDHPGTPRPELLNFFPPFSDGNYTDAAQATWTVTGNADYVLYGGEFTRVSGVAQQGLVRFAVRTKAPNQRGPRLTSTQWMPRLKSLEPGTVRVQWQPNVDWDDHTIRYQVFRGSMSNQVYETTQTGRFWENGSMVFTDQGLAPGSTVQYRIRARDRWGNIASSDWSSVTVAVSGNLDTYARRVLADGATKYWRLNEASGRSVNDSSGTDNPTAGTGVTRNVAGALLSSGDSATAFNGTTSGRVISTQPFDGSAATAGPQSFTVEAWFKTSSSAGGKILGYGNSATGTSSTYDRDLYLDSSRRVSFSLGGRTRIVLRTDAAYNDNQWHHVVGTFSQAAGAALYVDGRRVAFNDTLPAVREYRGYWRVGGDGSASGSQNLSGAIDEVAIYDRGLTPREVNAHWVASGRPSAVPNQSPSASFTFSGVGGQFGFDASASVDPDGSIASYAWDFGDGTQGSGVTAGHAYARPGSYDVRLTVTDDEGATASVTRQVTIEPPANVVPVAGFGFVADGLRVSFDGSGSSDSDGSVASYAWDFGDGHTSSGVSVEHTYAQPGTYAVKLTVTDDRGGSGSVTKQVTVVEPAAGVLARDGFDRSVSSGWGSAEVGGAWSVRGWPATSFSVGGGAGRLENRSGQSLYADLAGVSSRRTRVVTEFSMDKVVDQTYVGVVGRQVGGDSYVARLTVTPSGQGRLYTLQNFNAVASSYLMPEVLVPGERYKIAIEVTGTSPTTVSSKVWKSSDPEPDWQRTGTSSFAGLQGPGSVGVFSFLPNAASASSPVTVSVEDFTATDPAA